MPTNDMSQYEWRITIGIQRHWVTAEEKDTYLRSIAKGMDLVPIRGGTIFLGKNPQEIIHCGALDESRRIEEYRKDGKYQCEHGYWHQAGTTCMHNIELIEQGDSYLMIEKGQSEEKVHTEPKQLPTPQYERAPAVQRQFQKLPQIKGF